MTEHPEEPPFKRYGAYYPILKIVVIAAAALLAAKLLNLI
jgi:hypothetical protein